MKRIFKLYTMAFAISIFSALPRAHALLEARGFAGFAFSASNSMNSRLANSGITQVFATGMYGVDAVLRIPMTGLGFGLRYDWQGIKVDATSAGFPGNEFEVSSRRTAVVGSYRFVDRVGYVGLIGTYGITHQPSVRIKESNVVTNYDSTGKATSGTIGVEGGVKLGGLMLGGEAGYQDYLVRELGGPNGPANFDLNFAGFYGVLHFGVGF